MGAEDYQGGRMASAITSYALSKLDEYGIEPEVQYTAAAAAAAEVAGAAQPTVSYSHAVRCLHR